MSRAENRKQLLAHLPKNAIGAEIGVDRGQFSSVIKQIAGPKHLYLVDPWLYQKDRLSMSFGLFMNQLRKEEITTLGGPQQFMDAMHAKISDLYSADDTVSVCRETSQSFFDRLIASGQKLDWVYIDGDHSEAAVHSDISKAIQVVRDGGIIAGDDFGHTDMDTAKRNRDGSFVLDEAGKMIGNKSVKLAINRIRREFSFARESFSKFGGQWYFVNSASY